MCNYMSDDAHSESVRSVYAVSRRDRESLKKCTSLESVKTPTVLGRPQSNMELGRHLASALMSYRLSLAQSALKVKVELSHGLVRATGRHMP